MPRLYVGDAGRPNYPGDSVRIEILQLAETGRKRAKPADFVENCRKRANANGGRASWLGAEEPGDYDPWAWGRFIDSSGGVETKNDAPTTTTT